MKYQGRRFWISSLVSLSILFTSGCIPMQNGRTAQRINPKSEISGTESYLSGYSKKYQPYREMLSSGRTDDILKQMTAEEVKNSGDNKNYQERMDDLRLVDLMERVSLYLQLGEADKSLDYSRYAKTIIEERDSESYLGEGASLAANFFSDFFGAGEFGRYNAPGYEKVMLLNMASMAFLLNGDERAFNVARLAVQWQEGEKESFESELAEVKKEDGKNEEKDNAKTKQETNRLMIALDSEFSKYEAEALTVPSAFVNPFADYVTGMINEFKSTKLSSLLSNANIAYKDALKLNPTSKVLQQAVRDTENKRSAKRLIHIVAMDGLIPAKKVLSIPIDRDLDVELPSYKPDTSRVARIKVLTDSGKLLATLSPVANLEALAFRHQKDSLPYIKTMIITAAARDAAMLITADLIAGAGGIVRSFMDDKQEPDTTSWLTLPSSILAARIYAPSGLKKLKIYSYDKKGRILGRKTVKLAKGNNHFVLARTINETIYAHPSKPIWSAKL